MNKDFWNRQTKPIIALAPMDGYTDSAFRRVCKSVNPTIIVFTEFTSVEGLAHGAQKLRDRFRYDPEEQPIIGQIFGHDIASFVQAAQWLEEQGFAGVDINMGCPSPKVVKSEQGIGLRRTPEHALQIIEAVAKATRLPVSVKTRLGLSDASDLNSFGRGVQDAGANLITIHGRTYDEPYNCPADFAPIEELKQQLSIPVIGNGGILSVTDGKEKLGTLDGFMIGRAAIGNPWVFSEQPKPAFADKVPLIKKHAEDLFILKGEKIASMEIRKYLAAYVRGLPNASQYRQRLVRVTSLEEIHRLLDAVTKDVMRSPAG